MWLRAKFPQERDRLPADRWIISLRMRGFRQLPDSPVVKYKMGQGNGAGHRLWRDSI